MRAIKIIGAVFCGWLTLGGVVAVFTSSSSEPAAVTLLITLVFFISTVLLIRSIRKGNTTKQQPPHSSANASGRPSYTYRASPSAAPAIVPAEPSHELSPEVAQTVREVPIAQPRDLADPFKHIPDEVLKLLWFSNGPNRNYFGQSNEVHSIFAGIDIQIGSCSLDEPSAIDVELPLAPGFCPPTPLGYYPSYEALDPRQRTAYLNWLIDITVPIDIGYVFIFYYGLERHLFFGESEAALAAILVLRKFHDNKSFQHYSDDALLLYALTHNRPEILQHIELQRLAADTQLFAAAISQHCFSPQDIMSAHRKFSFENTRYIKAEPELFLSTLTDLLLERYGSQGFEITLEDFQTAKSSITLALANYSLLPAQRFLSLPDIATSPRVHDSIYRLLIATHESVKVKLRELRKQAAKNK